MTGIAKAGVVAGAVVVTDAVTLTGMRYGMSNEQKDNLDVVCKVALSCVMEKEEKASNIVSKTGWKLYGKFLESRRHFVCDYRRQKTETVKNTASVQGGVVIDGSQANVA